VSTPVDESEWTRTRIPGHPPDEEPEYRETGGAAGDEPQDEDVTVENPEESESPAEDSWDS
jgi:hypothetical protein